MNKEAIYHRSESNFCFPIDEKTICLRIRFVKNEKLDSVSVLYNTKYEIANSQFKTKLCLLCCDGNYDYYGITLKLFDSRLAYVFEIKSKGKIYYFCENGIKDNYDFSVAYYDSFQYAFINKNDIQQNVSWLNNAVFYQIFIDRFAKGSVKNENYINAKWNDLPTRDSFFGGDLDGIIEHLDYIKSLGVTSLYLTPIFKSISNHKYDIIDYYVVDEMFGGKKALKRLVNESHKRGIRVVLDAVFNHVSDLFPPFQDVLKKGNKSKYFDWFIIDGKVINQERSNYCCFATCNYMPKLNTNNQSVQKYLIDVSTYYLKKFNIDGWRLDVSDEVSHDFWRKMRKAVKTVKSDAALIGENWHNSETYLYGDQFDSIMNYSVTKAFLDFWAKDSLNELQMTYELNSQLMRYTDITNGMMFNLLDSHDTYRFFSEIGCNVDKLICSLAMITFLPGSVNLYYGTEILTEGGYDPDSRRTFDFSRVNNSKYYKYTKQIANILKLKNQPALIYGSVKIYEENGLLIIERKCSKQSLVLKISKKEHEVESNYSLSYNVSDKMLSNSYIIEGKVI